jgi:FixJ family two-component response regulator
LEHVSPRSPATSYGFLPHGVTVFIVEDDDAARHSLAASLEALGCVVKTFASCESFLAHAKQARPGCLLLDYHFEGLSGLGLLDNLRDAGIFVPTVLFTGKFGAFLKRRATNYPEVVAVLDKPLDGRPLLDALRRACALI